MALNLTPLSNVTYLGRFFLSGCRALTKLDLAPLGDVESTGGFFLKGCSGLKELHLGSRSIAWWLPGGGDPCQVLSQVGVESVGIGELSL